MENTEVKPNESKGVEENPYLEIEHRINASKKISATIALQSPKGIAFVVLCVLTLSILGLVLYDGIRNIISLHQIQQDHFVFHYGEQQVSYFEMQQKEADVIDFNNPYSIDTTSSDLESINGSIKLQDQTFYLNINGVTDRFLFYKLGSKQSSSSFWNPNYEVSTQTGTDLSSYEKADYLLCYGLPINKKLRPVTLAGNDKTLLTSKNYSIYSVNSTLRDIVLRIN